MKKRKNLLLALMFSLVLANTGGIVASAAVPTGIIQEGNTLKDANNGEGAGSGTSEGNGTEGEGKKDNSSSSQDKTGLNMNKMDSAVDAVTAGSELDQGAFTKAQKSLKGFTDLIQTIIGFMLVVITAWIPLTFIADILVYFIPALDRFIGDGGGAGGAAGPGGSGGRGFHIKLTSHHRLGGGGMGGAPAGPGGAGGGAGAQWGQYFKDRMIELIYTFGLIGLLVSGLYNVLLNKIVHYLMLIIKAILGLIMGILDDLLK